jgi:multidrug resistance efflux pump
MLTRVKLSIVGGLQNDAQLNAVVGLRETEITWAMKETEARGLRLGDTFTLNLTADPKGK